MNLLAEIPIFIPDEEVKYAPILELEVIDSPAVDFQDANLQAPSLYNQSLNQLGQNYRHYLKKGLTFKINAQGLIGSKRNKQDGCVFFGSSSATIQFERTNQRGGHSCS